MIEYTARTCTLSVLQETLDWFSEYGWDVFNVLMNPDGRLTIFGRSFDVVEQEHDYGVADNNSTFKDRLFAAAIRDKGTNVKPTQRYTCLLCGTIGAYNDVSLHADDCVLIEIYE